MRNSIILKEELTKAGPVKISLNWWLLPGIVLLAANLRAPITAIGPVVGTIRDDTGLSNTFTGLLTTLPLLGFGLVSPVAPGIARRLGMELTLMLSLIGLTAGILLRGLPSIAALYFGTALLGMAIAVANVLLPALIKREFPARIGLMTAVYSTSMNLFGAIATGVSIPLVLGVGLGWRGMLVAWVILPLIAIAAWLPQLRYRHRPETTGQRPGASLWRSRLAWQVTLFMGFQSMIFYATLTWLPEMLNQWGLSIADAGWMVSLLQFVSLPASFIAPLVAGRWADQRKLTGAVILALVVGYIGLLTGNTPLLPLWVILIGAGGGASFSLVITFFGFRASNPQQAAGLSGMAQSVGYLMAAAGPILFGLIHDLAHSWTPAQLTLVGLTFLLLLAGVGAGRNTTISDEG
jgi:CP family cyanate transporter-like MFS transporter